MFTIDEHGMILFSPDERNTFTDASYHLPAFYELWARWGPEEDRAFWARAAAVSGDYFVKSAHPKTGLLYLMSLLHASGRFQVIGPRR
jgi:oligosaccharide reducing-end xylanase